MIDDVGIVSFAEYQGIKATNEFHGLWLTRAPRKGRFKGLFVALDNRNNEQVEKTFVALHDAKEWLEERMNEQL